MPDPNLGQEVANAWEAVVGKTPEDNIFEDYWLQNRFSQGDGFKSINGGRSINPTIEYGTNTTVRSYSGHEALDTNPVDVFDEAKYSWKEYAGTVSMSELERAKNQGEGRKFALEAAKLENLRNSFAKIFNEDLFSDGTANGSKVFGGLRHIVADVPTTGTVGGINRSTFSFWRNQTVNGAKTTTPFDNVRGSIRQIANLVMIAKGKSGFVVTTRAVHEGVEGLLVANERYTRDSADDKGVTGFDTLIVSGLLMSFDNDCLAARAYVLNTKALKLAYQKGYWMKGFAPVDPANQTVDVFKVMTIANLYSPNPRRLGVVEGIT